MNTTISPQISEKKKTQKKPWVFPHGFKFSRNFTSLLLVHACLIQAHLPVSLQDC